MSFPTNFKLSEVSDIKNTVPQTVSNAMQTISTAMQANYIDRNESGVLELDTTSEKSNISVPLTIYFFEQGPYADIVNTTFEYFVDPAVNVSGTNYSSTFQDALNANLALQRNTLERESHSVVDLGTQIEKGATDGFPKGEFPEA
jgi:hypothetical protein